jgi:murein DD-endopeptidase MepM/ murein hydrolase activator NlpD
LIVVKIFLRHYTSGPPRIEPQPVSALLSIQAVQAAEAAVGERFRGIQQAIFDELEALSIRMSHLETRERTPPPPELEVVDPFPGFKAVTKSRIAQVETEPEHAVGYENAVGLRFEAEAQTVVVSAMHSGTIARAELDPEPREDLQGRFLIVVHGDDGTKSLYGLLSRHGLDLQEIAAKDALIGTKVSVGQTLGYSDTSRNAAWLRLGLISPQGQGVNPLTRVAGYNYAEGVTTIPSIGEAGF